MKKGVYLAFIFCFCLVLVGCVEKEPDYTKEKVIKKSQRRRPKWTHENVIQGSSYIYFVGKRRAVQKTPSFSQKHAYKILHAYLKEDAERFLESLKKSLSVSVYNKEVKKFVQTVSKKIIMPVRKQNIQYWETVELFENGKRVVRHDYYVLIRLNRSALRRTERLYLYKEKKLAMLRGKGLRESAFKKVVSRYKEYIEFEKKEMPSYKTYKLGFKF